MITKLTLSNFKCFKEAHIFNLKKVNLFTGYNGRGKSTIFQSLLLLAQTVYDGKNLQNLLVNGIFCNLGLFEDLLNDKKSDDSFHIIINTDYKDKIKQIEISYKELSDRKGTLSSMKVDNEESFQTVKKLDGSEETLKAEYQGYDSKVNDIFQNFYFVSADRLGPTPFEVKKDLYDNNPIGNNGEYRLNVLAGQKELQKDLADIITKIMDGGILNVSGDESESKKTDVLKLYFNTINNEKKVSSINSGFGYSYVLPIILAALTMKNGSLFIENPEAHLHPFAQSQLIKELIKIALKNNIQLYIESHSEHVINAVRLCVLYEGDYSELKNTDVSTYFFDKNMEIIPLFMKEDAQMDNWPSGFFDQAERDAAEILKLGLLK